MPKTGVVGVALEVSATLPVKPWLDNEPEGKLPSVRVAVPVLPDWKVTLVVSAVILKSCSRTMTDTLLVFDCPPTVAVPLMLTE